MSRRSSPRLICSSTAATLPSRARSAPKAGRYLPDKRSLVALAKNKDRLRCSQAVQVFVAVLVIFGCAACSVLLGSLRGCLRIGILRVSRQIVLVGLAGVVRGRRHFGDRGGLGRNRGARSLAGVGSVVRRRGAGRFLGADVGEHNEAGLRVGLGQAGAGPGGNGRGNRRDISNRHVITLDPTAAAEYPVPVVEMMVVPPPMTDPDRGIDR